MKLNGGASPDLVTVRRKKGVSLQDISQATRISVSYLQAIEDGEFARLPGGVYNVSYLRQYARAIDYNESELVEQYYQEMAIVPDPPSSQPVTPVRKSFTDFLRPVIRVLS